MNAECQEDNHTTAPKPKKKWTLNMIVLSAATAIVVILALSLGLGLGLGLKKKNGNTIIRNPSPPSPPPPTSSEGWRRDPQDYILSPDFDTKAPNTTRYYTLNLTELPNGSPDGVSVRMLIINGKFPGPVIEANEGDQLVVQVNNFMTLPSAIHWHGQYQNGTGFMDGTYGITQCAIKPNTSFTYNFTLQQSGTYWYHAHYSTEYQDGLFGPLIIHGRNEVDYNISGDFILMVDDWYHDFSMDLLPVFFAPGNEGVEPVPDNGLINGFGTCTSCNNRSLNVFACERAPGYTCDNSSASHAVFNVTANARYRFRVINTGAFADFKFSVDGHGLELIEADGTPLSPLSVHTFPIHVAQRYSFILETNQSATSYWIRAVMNTNCFNNDNPQLDPNVLGILHYNTTPLSTPNTTSWDESMDVVCRDLDLSELVPLNPLPLLEPDLFVRIDTSFQTVQEDLNFAFINGTSWVPLNGTNILGQVATTQGNYSVQGVDSTDFPIASQFVYSFPEIKTVDFLINNLDEGTHPFHLHGHKFWVMAQGDGNYNTSVPLATTPVFRDTVSVQGYGFTLIRFVSDNPGAWAFHCHITWHMEAGLLMTVLSGAGKIPSIVSGAPSSWASLCRA